MFEVKDARRHTKETIFLLFPCLMKQTDSKKFNFDFKHLAIDNTLFKIYIKILCTRNDKKCNMKISRQTNFFHYSTCMYKSKNQTTMDIVAGIERPRPICSGCVGRTFIGKSQTMVCTLTSAVPCSITP